MDKLVQFSTSLEDFLKHDEKNVLVIKGPWGVGKTYFWNHFIRTTTSYQEKTYSYVSLFSLSSISEIQSEIYYNSAKIGEKDRAESIAEQVRTITKYTKLMPKVNKYANALSIIEKRLIKEFLICIDDIERKNSDLSMSTILGLVSELSVENKCKFILIFNEGTLTKSDKEEFNKYREKVVDLELEYNPPVEHNQDLIFTNHAYKEVIYKTLSPLELKNIRILKHIKWNVETLLDNLSTFEPEVANEIIATTTLLTYIHHDSSIETPIRELESIFSFTSDITEKQKEQRNLLQAAGYVQFADYEKELVKYISDGVYDKQSFNKEISLLNDRQRVSNFKKDLDQAWGPFSNNFTATIEEVVNGFSSFLDKHVKEMSYREIEPMISTIRKLDDTKQTQSWLDTFITTNVKNFSRKEIQFFRTITTNSILLEQLDSQEKLIFSSNSIEDTLRQIIKNSGWNEEDVEFLDSHTQDELYDWLQTGNNSNFLSTLRGAIRCFPPLDGDSHRESFGAKLHNALNKLGDRSHIDKIRIEECLGIEINTKHDL